MDEVAVADIPAGWVLLDVREDDEWNAGHAPGATHIPLGDIPARSRELDPDQPYAVICRSGGRSARAAAWLEQAGFEVANVAGGMQAWEAGGGPTTGPVI